MTINYAHRGASGYCPENTMAAFLEAVKLGATGIETDVQMTSDGKLVLIHDENLARTTGINQLVKDLSYEEICKLDAGSWFHPDFVGETIPTLDQLLELGKEHQLMINIEIKSGLVQYPGIEKKIIDAVYEHDMTSQVIISSFDHYALAVCKKVDPSIPTAILYAEGLYEPWNYAASLQANALHAPKYAVTKEWVQQAKERQMIYNIYTVNDPNEMKVLLDVGVGGIFTDYPDRLNKLILGEK